ncbi:hypothetical protein EDB84DRAFT_1587204 [Lactarius hengduanensis]|nr:hypothetical protein EDB84DRAFT_1587204 [Lactarius hengduanensis]
MGDLYPHIDPSHERDFPLSPRPGFSHSSERPPTLSQLGKNRADMRIDFNRDHLSYLEAAASSTQPPGQSRRSRKDKMRIELSADQPPTTQGRPRTRVFVACLQCRGRKIRCDGAKPECHHCCQRGGNEQCTYDSQPKRRGPDRVQGARTRGTGPSEGDGEPARRRRRRPPMVDRDTTPQEATSSYGIKLPLAPASPSALDILGDPVPDVSQHNAGAPNHSLEVDVFQPLGSGVRLNSIASHDQTLTSDPIRNRNPPHDTRAIGYNSEVPNSGTIAPFGAATDTNQETSKSQTTLPPIPSVQFRRKTWWDHLLRVYAPPMTASYHSLPLGQMQRDASVNQIVEDVRFLFKTSSYWFSFLNVPRFYKTFTDPARRGHMQPSLLLSLLAVSTLVQSSQQACPEESRRKAIMLRDEAQSALEASLYARAIDGELAQAAWVLSFFEVCAHPQNQATRTQSSLNILDSIIRALTMTHLDSDTPAASRFASNGTPVVDARLVGYFPATEQHNPSSVLASSSTRQYVQQSHMAIEPAIHRSRCSCDEVSLGRHWPEAQRQVPLWVATPTWNREWSEGEIKKEECRRLCWSALMLISAHTSYAVAANWRHSDFFVMEPSNVRTLLNNAPNSSPNLGGKDTVWALYLRAMLLWNACVRMRHDATASDHDRTEFAMRTWMETEAIEKALQQHTCGIERAFMYNGREFLFNTRMCISYEFQRFVPHVLIGLNRKKSEEWLRAQGQRAKTVMLGMHAVTGNIKNNLAQRPSFVWWFMGQIFRALTLWEQDNSLTIALDVCKAFLEPVQFLTSIYPGPTQQFRFDDLRERLRIACLTAEATRGYNPNSFEML